MEIIPIPASRKIPAQQVSEGELNAICYAPVSITSTRATARSRNCAIVQSADTWRVTSGAHATCLFRKRIRRCRRTEHPCPVRKFRYLFRGSQRVTNYANPHSLVCVRVYGKVYAEKQGNKKKYLCPGRRFLGTGSTVHEFNSSPMFVAFRERDPSAQCRCRVNLTLENSLRPFIVPYRIKYPQARPTRCCPSLKLVPNRYNHLSRGSAEGIAIASQARAYSQQRSSLAFEPIYKPEFAFP